MLCYAKSLQSCPTLCDAIDGSPPGSPIPGTLQARTLEWVAISFSNAWKGKVKVKSLSHIRLLVTPWMAAYQAPPPMGFSRQEYWNGLTLPFPYKPHICSQIIHLRFKNITEKNKSKILGSAYVETVWKLAGASVLYKFTPVIWTKWNLILKE